MNSSEHQAIGVLVVFSVMFCLAVGGPVKADESGKYQRVASYVKTPVELSGDATVLAQPGSDSRIAVGGLELQVGVRLWDCWNLEATGRLPVDVVAQAGETYQLYRSDNGSAVVSTAYSFGPPHLRHRLGTSRETDRTWSLSYVIAAVRDPMVQGIGVTADVNPAGDDGWEVEVRVPLSVALVVNDVTSLHGEVIPALEDVFRTPRSALTAVISVRWAWEQFNIGYATLFGEHGAPGGMALAGGWRWKRK